MSIHILTEFTQIPVHLQDAVQAAAILPMASDDLIGFAGEKVEAIRLLFRALSVVVGIGFVIWQAWTSRGAAARIAGALLTAGLLIWGVFHITEVQDRVDNEVNSAPVPATVSGAGALSAGGQPTTPA